jgi:NADH-quinone oxidoreductase subunit L
MLEVASGVVAIVGILLAAWLWLGKRTLVTSIANSARPSAGYLVVQRVGLRLAVRSRLRQTIPRCGMAVETRSAECLMNIPAILSRFAGKGLLLSENGYLRWYVASMSIGAVVILALLMVLR